MAEVILNLAAKCEQMFLYDLDHLNVTLVD